MAHSVDNVNNKITLATEVFDTIHTLMHRFKSQQFRALRDGPTAVTHLEAKALSFFRRHPGATSSEWVAHSGRDKAQIARLIAGLKDKDLLRTEADPADRRVQRLYLTDQAQAAMQAVRAQGDALAQAAVRDISKAECAQLLDLLQRVQANLDE